MGALGGGGKGGGGGGSSGGINPFESAMLNQAVGQNQRAMTNRYNQLGLGGSTMEQQDLQGMSLAGLAGAAGLEQGNLQNQQNLANQLTTAGTEQGQAAGLLGNTVTGA